MFLNATGLILADDRRILLGDLSHPRALSAVPFGGRYRMIDFGLSNMTNSGITCIGVSTFTKYKSLMDHLGTGSAWDLDRKNQGLSILAPYNSSQSYVGKGDDLLGILNFYRESKREYIIVSSSDCIFNTTYDDLIAYHKEKEADITVMYNNDGISGGVPNVILDLDENKKVREVYSNPSEGIFQEVLASSIGTLVMRLDLFINILSRAVARDISEINIEYLLRACHNKKVFGFEYKGVVLRINSLKSYFNSTMRALDDDVRKAIFWPEQPVYTKVKDEAPSFYSEHAKVEGSMISDGCLIEGTIKHSMIFRGVVVSEGSVLENCIIFQNTRIDESCHLENVIVDKDCVIRPGTRLIGQKNYPIVIGKGEVV